MTSPLPLKDWDNAHPGAKAENAIAAKNLQPQRQDCKERMAPEDLEKEYWYLKFLYEATHKKGFSMAPPNEALIEVSAACNLSCTHCPQAFMVREKSLIEPKLFEKIIKELAPYKSFIAFQLQGEPTTHKSLADMIRMVKDNGLKSRLITNATLLNKEKSKEFISAGLDYIYFSMNGGDKESYEKVNVNSNFELVVNNMLDFLEAKEELGAYHVRTRTSFVFENQNKHMARRYKKFFGAMPFDRIDLTKLFNFFGLNDEVELTLGELLKQGKKVVCEYPWRYMAVTSTGLVRACIFDYDDDLIIGDANRENIMDIWNGERMRAFRRAHLSGDFSQIPGAGRTCLRCSTPCYKANVWPNSFAEEAEKMYARGHVESFKSDENAFERKFEYMKKFRKKWMEDIMNTHLEEPSVVPEDTRDTIDEEIALVQKAPELLDGLKK